MFPRLAGPLSALVAWASLSATLHAGQPGDLTRLHRLLDEASFDPVEESDLVASRAELLRLLQRAPSGVTADDWEFLQPDLVAESLRENGDSLLDDLESLIEQLTQNQQPNGNSGLLELRRVARRHLRLVADQKRADLEPLFYRAKAAVHDALTQYQHSHALQQHHRIANGVRWLAEHEQASEFVRAAKQELSFPNLEIHLSAGLMRELSKQTMQQSEPLSRSSDGIQTRGTVATNALAFLEPADSIGYGLMKMRFTSETRLSATNNRKRVQFRSYATTRAKAIANITVDQRGAMKNGSPQVCAHTDLRNCRATVNRALGRRAISMIVNRVIARKTPELEAELSRQVSDQVKKELNSQLDKIVSSANEFVSDNVLRFAGRIDLAPRILSVRTTQERLQLSATEDLQDGFASPTPFIAPANAKGIAAVHQSLLTNLINIWYVRDDLPGKLDAEAMQTFNESLALEMFAEQELPEEYSVTLHLDFPRPFHVDFQSGVVSITIRADKLTLNEQDYANQNVSISYRVSLRPGGDLDFELQGAPQVLPRGGGKPDVPPELVKAVRGELFAGLQSSFLLSPDELYGGDGEIPVALQDVNLGRGWLSLHVEGKQAEGPTESLLSF